MDRMVSLAVLLLCFSLAAHAQTCDDEGIATEINIHIREITANLGNPLFLRCDVILDPGTLADMPPIIESYIWRRNGVVLPEFTGDSLRVDNVVSSDGGEYTCSADTDWPCTTVESDITTVSTTPTVTLDPRSDFTVTVGERVELTCLVEGWPTPTIQWTRATGIGTVVDISTNPTYVIDSASLNDATEYTCIATNGGGSDRDTIILTVVEPTVPTTEPTSTPPTIPTGDNQMSNGTRPRPEQEIGFFIGIGVTAFVCLALTVLTLISVIVWYVMKRKEEKQAQYYGDEEIIMEPIEN